MARVIKSRDGDETFVPRGGVMDAWGHQIRSYVLQPYTMAKDLRTGVQTSDVRSVLDGDLDDFLRARLAQCAGDA